MKNKFIIYTFFTGLGLWNGYRGDRWLKNRIQIFKQFVIPSLLNQTDRDFVHWISWRPEEEKNPQVIELKKYLDNIPNYKCVFTYGGVCVFDDKYPDDVARERLANALHDSLYLLFDYLPDCDNVYWLLQPSDDLYKSDTVEEVKKAFQNYKAQAVSFLFGYICNYQTKEIHEYNPNTNPPFFAINFPRETFFDEAKHMTYISLKSDEGKYKKGTPQPSHEYLAKCLDTFYFEYRGFCVGCHGCNISTHFNHPFKGGKVGQHLLDNFGILNVPNLSLPVSTRKWLMRKLPYQWQKKLRYLIGEELVGKIYEYLRR